MASRYWGIIITALRHNGSATFVIGGTTSLSPVANSRVSILRTLLLQAMLLQWHHVTLYAAPEVSYGVTFDIDYYDGCLDVDAPYYATLSFKICLLVS